MLVAGARGRLGPLVISDAVQVLDEFDYSRAIAVSGFHGLEPVAVLLGNLDWSLLLRLVKLLIMGDPADPVGETCRA